MEKLTELLNEYERSKGTNLEITNWKCVYGNLSYFGYGNGYSDLLCISKRYEFIQRLVDNDKIERKKIEKNQIYQSCLALLIDRGYYEKVLLMLLAISDKPIEDLISYLKIS